MRIISECEEVPLVALVTGEWLSEFEVSDALPDEVSSKVFFRVRDDSSASSGIVANFFSTCFKAGRRIGLLYFIS
jgi:hypothetical protein